jgi:GTPase SAR1 family protein
MNIDVEDYDDIHKIIVIGDSNTGKTSLVQAFSKHKLPLIFKPTIGV